MLLIIFAASCLLTTYALIFLLHVTYFMATLLILTWKLFKHLLRLIPDYVVPSLCIDALEVKPNTNETFYTRNTIKGLSETFWYQ